MAFINREVRDFSKGTVTVIDDHAIPRGAASFTKNMINVGDGIELVPGARIIGTAINDSGRIAGLGLIQDVNGVDRIYRVRGTYLELFNTATDTWDTVKNDLTDDVDTSLFGYRTPAGAFLTLNSVSDGPLRVNLANPTSIADFYDATINFRGIMPTYLNRMYVVQREGNETTMYVSKIDDDYPYTAVNNENIGTGDGATLTFADTLTNPLVAGRTINVTAGAVTGTDNGSGVISGSGITGTINYTTGAISVTFTVAPAGAVAIECDYSYETPDDGGLLDFRYSGTRLAGEGDIVFQFEKSDPIQFVIYFKGTHYVFHKRSIWQTVFSDDDLTITNQILRNNTGLANWRAVCATNDGLYYADQADEERPVLRLLRYSEISDTTLPEEISVNLDLTGYNFDDSAVEEWGDYVIWLCKSPGATDNDTMVLYNKRWKTVDFAEGFYRCLARGQDGLYAGSSISSNVYKLFDGYDIDDVTLIGEWEGRDDDLDIDELKKTKKFILETEMVESQKVRLELSYDEEDFTDIGSIDGLTDFGQGVDNTTYGALEYSSAYGGATPNDRLRYLKEFRIGRAKFLRIKPRLVVYGEGFARVKMYVFKDVRKKGNKLPNKFR